MAYFLCIKPAPKMLGNPARDTGKIVREQVCIYGEVNNLAILTIILITLTILKIIIKLESEANTHPINSITTSIKINKNKINILMQMII